MIKDQPMNPECAGVYGQNFDKNEFKTKENATPRPWKVNPEGQEEYKTGAWEITSNIKFGKDPDDTCVALCYSYNAQDAEANARLIVKAVNCHDELVEALHAICNQFEAQSNPDIVLVGWKSIQRGLKALSKAESEF